MKLKFIEITDDKGKPFYVSVAHIKYLEKSKFENQCYVYIEGTRITVPKSYEDMRTEIYNASV